jgi:hypothetical protein
MCQFCSYCQFEKWSFFLVERSLMAMLSSTVAIDIDVVEPIKATVAQHLMRFRTA